MEHNKMTEAQQANAPFGIPDAAPEQDARDVFGLRRKYVKLSVYEDNSPGAESVCKVGVNGRVFLLRRGVVNIVSVDVRTALDNAEQNVLVKGDGELIVKPAKRFPYQFHGDATEAEYQAYQKKMRDEQQARAMQVVA